MKQNKLSDYTAFFKRFSYVSTRGWHSTLFLLLHREAVRCFRPVAEVLLPRRCGILSSNLSLHQRFQSLCNYRPRIPRARCLCWPSHRRLLFDELGANFSCRCFRGPCKRLHQWLLEPSTLRHWRWNTTVCSKHDSRRDEGFHWKRLVAQFWMTSCWKGIPMEINQGRKKKTGKTGPAFHWELIWCTPQQLSLVNGITRVPKCSLFLLIFFYICLQSSGLGNAQIHTFIKPVSLPSFKFL